jgi:hypothetical protein
MTPFSNREFPHDVLTVRHRMDFSSRAFRRVPPLEAGEHRAMCAVDAHFTSKWRDVLKIRGTGDAYLTESGKWE